MNQEVKNALEKGTDYSSFRAMVSELVAREKSTGENQSEAYVHYTKMNDARMRRLDKTVEILPEIASRIKAISNSQTWLVITESWCGDAAQVVPIIQKMSDLNDLITVKVILRDENLEVMDQYLTNGGRSIPKIVAWNTDSGEELGDFGPRPAQLQQMVMDNKHSANPVPYDEFSKVVQKWYLEDKGASTQSEFLDAIVA